jgi:uncharacterized protein YeaO (DUF488 family)
VTASVRRCLKTRSVSSPINRTTDGLRILVPRFRGRGLPAWRYDVWMPNLGPSERLLGSFQNRRLSWARFSRQYLRELFLDGPIDRHSRIIKNHGQKFTLRLLKQLAGRGPVTLMCHCAEDQLQCHRHVLQELIISNRV